MKTCEHDFISIKRGYFQCKLCKKLYLSLHDIYGEGWNDGINQGRKEGEKVGKAEATLSVASEKNRLCSRCQRTSNAYYDYDILCLECQEKDKEAERTKTLDEVREILKVEIKQSCACVKDYVCDLHTILKKISKLRLKGVPDKGRGGKT